jgi:hypothetical protein
MARTTKPSVIKVDSLCHVTTYNIIFEEGYTPSFPFSCHNLLGTFFHWVLERIGFDFSKKKANTAWSFFTAAFIGYSGFLGE